MLFIAIIILLFLFSAQPAPAVSEEQPGAPFGQSDQTAGNSRSESDPYADLPYKYVGNSFSHKFHRPSCPFARAMSPAHLCLFHFRKQAVEAAYLPCRYCLPPDWKTVGAVILPREVDPGSPATSRPPSSSDSTGSAGFPQINY